MLLPVYPFHKFYRSGSGMYNLYQLINMYEEFHTENEPKMNKNESEAPNELAIDEQSITNEPNQQPALILPDHGTIPQTPETIPQSENISQLPFNIESGRIVNDVRENNKSEKPSHEILCFHHPTTTMSNMSNIGNYCQCQLTQRNQPQNDEFIVLNKEEYREFKRQSKIIKKWKKFFKMNNYSNYRAKISKNDSNIIEYFYDYYQFVTCATCCSLFYSDCICHQSDLFYDELMTLMINMVYYLPTIDHYSTQFARPIPITIQEDPPAPSRRMNSQRPRGCKLFWKHFDENHKNCDLP